MAKGEADIGLIGLAVMGQNLVLNMEDHGFTVAVFNRTTSKVDDFTNGPAKGKKIIGAHDIKEFIGKLKTPRKVMMMVKAGKAVDAIIEQITPLLEKGDIIIDGGNSNWHDTERRFNELKEKGIEFCGVGISGGEDGARHGPSIMPGCSEEAWKEVKDILQTIAAKTKDGEPCCDLVGRGGAGHFVKMVHNGIEYGDIQLICEAYDLLTNVVGIKEKELSKIFAEWNKGELNSFLIEVAGKVFATEDSDGKPLLDKVLDVAHQKGTGKWTAINSLDIMMPAPLITEAVFARGVSTLKDSRVALSKVYKKHQKLFTGNKEEMVENIRKGLYASKIISYVQGYWMLWAASQKFDWKLNYSAIAHMWMEGCIIRSIFLGEIRKAFDKAPDLDCLLFDEFFKKALMRCQDGWRKANILAAEHSVAIPCFSSALSYFDAVTSERGPANLIQSIRDAFGAHTFERIGNPGKFEHYPWLGKGDTNVSAGSYNA